MSDEITQTTDAAASIPVIAPTEAPAALPPGDVAPVPAVIEPAADPSMSVGLVGNESLPPAAPEPAEDPNVASTAASAPESVMESSVGSVSAVSGTSPTGVSSVVSLPLESRIAPHLEAIYRLAQDEAARLPQTVTSAAAELKDHASDILHKLRNGMSVAEGEIVTKLERLIGML